MVQFVRVQESTYFDSVTLMLISSKLAELPQIKEAAVMMGTDHNKRLMLQSGVLNEANAHRAKPNDLIIGILGETQAAVEAALAQLNVLMQEKDLHQEKAEELKQITEKAVTPEEIEDLLFANKIVKHSKSNAIVLAKGKQLYASGVGQTSRVDSLRHAIEKAKSFNFDLKGAVMASDAFFPFPDCVEIAHKEGIDTVIQPGGSVRDDLTIDYCNKNGIAMVFTGIRHFKH